MKRTALAMATLVITLGAPLNADKHSAHQHSDRAPSAGAARKAGMAADESGSAIEVSIFRVTKAIRAPDNFMGGLAWDPEKQRLWLLSVGPPANTKTSSILYQIDPNSGEVLQQAKMPFLGQFGAPVYADGYLYVGIPHASTLFKVAVSDPTSFGEIVSAVPLPTLNDISVPLSEPFRYPFVNFPGLVFTPDRKLLLHAEDLGLFLTVDPKTGRLLETVRTLKGLGGTAAVLGPQREFLILGNADPEMTMLKRSSRVFMFRSAHGFTPPYAVQTEENCGRPGARDISWTLQEAASGEVLASTLDRCSRTKAGSVALIKQEPAEGFLFGRLTFLTVSDEEILTVEWRPR